MLRLTRLSNLFNLNYRSKFNKQQKKLFLFYSTETNSKIVIDSPILSSKEGVIGRTLAEHELLFMQKPEMPEDSKLVKVSLLGVPNSGKSTLVNRIMNRRICAVSSKMNTTKSRTTAVQTDNDTQMVILDTPGLVPFKKKKKFNMDRQMIIDPHSSLWEADVICVIHDVSNEFACDRIDREILKCLFTHPEKEAILILNKIDKLKNHKKLLDLVLELTGGRLNGKEFITKDKQDFKRTKSINSLRDFDYEHLFIKTAEKINIKLKDTSKKSKEILKLLDELKECEKYFLEHKSEIYISESKKNDTDVITDTSGSNGITLEKLVEQEENKYSLSKVSNSLMKNSNPELKLVGKILSKTAAIDQQMSPPSPKFLRSIEDISPADFKRDLMQTTDWHLYYQKLSALSVFVRDKTYWPYFNRVFLVSAKMNDGVDELKNYLLSRAKRAPWIFPPSLVTDQMPSDLIEMCVREKMLEYLPNELPYEMELATTTMDVDENDCFNVIVEIIPSRKTYKRQLSILFDAKARLIKLIREQTCQEMMKTFKCDVRLKLVIRTNPN